MHQRADFRHASPPAAIAVQAPPVATPPVVAMPLRLEADPSEPEPLDDCAAPEATLRAAQKAYASGEYDDAISLAELCTDVEPQRAMRIIGAASCVLHDLDCLKTAYRASDAPGRQYLVYTCQRHGISFRQRGKHLTAFVNKH